MLNKSYIKYMIIFIFKYKLCHVKRRRHQCYYLFIIIVVVNRCSLTLLETLLKCTDTYTKKDFPLLSPTFLGAKVINTNLVWRYLTVATVASHGNKSYSPFLCSSHSNLISWKLKNPVGSELSSQLRANNL